MRKAQQPVYINELSFDALIESTEEYAATAPAYPTEDGFAVSDTIILDPLSLSMTLYVTDTPVTWKDLHGVGEGRVEEVVDELIQIFRARDFVTIETTDKTYTDMIITSMSITKSAEVGYAREIPITFQEVVTTESKTGNVPSSYALSGPTMASTGTAGSGKAKESNITVTAALHDWAFGTGAFNSVTDSAKSLFGR